MSDRQTSMGSESTLVLGALPQGLPNGSHILRIPPKPCWGVSAGALQLTPDLQCAPLTQVPLQCVLG